MDVMYYGWLSSPIDIDAGAQIAPLFVLTDMVLYDCSQNFTAGNQLGLPMSRSEILQVCRRYIMALWLLHWLHILHKGYVTCF